MTRSCWTYHGTATVSSILRSPRNIAAAFRGFDDKIIALYARSIRARYIQGHVEEIYGVTISPNLFSAVTEAVMEYATAWQNLPITAAD